MYIRDHFWVSAKTLILETSKDGVLILSSSLSSNSVYFGDIFSLSTTTSILGTSYDGDVNKYFTLVIDSFQIKVVRRQSIVTTFRCMSHTISKASKAPRKRQVMPISQTDHIMYETKANWNDK